MSGDNPQLQLSIKTADGAAQHLRVDARQPILIGRDASCHVMLPSPEVSRFHVELRLHEGQVHLTDRSQNGTFLGREASPIKNATTPVALNVPFRVGPYTIRLVSPNASASRREDTPMHGESDEGISAKTLSPEMMAEQVRSRSASKSSAPKSKYSQSGTADVPVTVRRRLHRMLLDNLDLASLDRNKMNDKAMRPKVRTALTQICRQLQNELPAGTDIAELIEELTNEALGLGALEVLLNDESVSEIMVVDPTTIFIEREGKLEKTELRFTDNDAVRAVIERIVTPLGRRIDELNPLVDARLADGSRVNAVIPPLALRGPCITIRKFKRDPLGMDDLIGFGTLTDQMAGFLRRSVICRKNIVISGGTGSGKTTLLNVLSSAIPEQERVVTIEDAAELRLHQPHVVSLEARPANMEGRGQVTIRDLVRNALRMRPDRIVVGECRGGECIDMLQAMNTGHEGSMTTTHANSPSEALARLEVLALMSGLDLPSRAIREQIASSVHLIVQQSRHSDGARRIEAVSEVCGISDEGEVQQREIFRFYRTGTAPGGKIQGEFRATGYLPSFLDEFITHGLVEPGEYL